MAVVLGTSAGFVTVAPTADPTGTAGGNFDNGAVVQKDTSPATAAKIIEVGWYAGLATQAADFEVGLYDASGAVVPGEAGVLLFVSGANAKGTTEGWKVVTVDWTISASTVYWLGVHCADTSTATPIDYTTTGGPGFDLVVPKTSLTDPFGGGAIFDADGVVALYAVWEAAAAGGQPPRSMHQFRQRRAA